MDAQDELQNRTVTFAHQASLGLPGSIKQVADFLLAEGTGIANLTMAEIAARTYTSKPTLVRFAKQAGYNGWKDYRSDFLEAMARIEDDRIRAAEVDVNHPFDAGSPSSEVIDSISHIYRLALEEFEVRVDQQALEGAARSILEARDVVFFGAMQNYHRGRVFASNLGLIGILCRTPLSDETAPVVRRLDKGDCVVVASYSGDLNHAPMRFVPELQRHGVTIVAVTGAANSDLARSADHVLSFRALEHYHDKVGAFYSGACTTLILDALYACCYATHFDESRSSKEAILEDLRGVISEGFSAPSM